MSVIESSLPMADARHDEKSRKTIHTVVGNRNLAKATNNTRWNELITYFRERQDWRPSYRSKSITGHISGWDVEWFYHLPFPFATVEWFDIGLSESLPSKGRLLPQQTVDHTSEISKVLSAIGFDFEICGDVARIWGYLPKSREDFPPNVIGSCAG